MSLKIIKGGLLDTVQDEGRYGYQHLGINPNGAMDRHSARLANALLGKALSAPVLELHFPTASILFKEATVICITGAHFMPVVNEQPLPINQPVAIAQNTVLQFKRAQKGARCYLSVLHEMDIPTWLHSCSTNLKAAAGGWEGRALQSGDVIPFKNVINHTFSSLTSFTVLPWKAVPEITSNGKIQFIMGAEWCWLTNDAKDHFQKTDFQVSTSADRMGYRLIGKGLEAKEKANLVSAAVNFGTVQLLPDGQLVVLMADHQTTGGYPRIAQVTSQSLQALAQLKPNDRFQFELTDLAVAEQKMAAQQKYLQQLQIACKFKIENHLNATLRPEL